MVCRKSEVGFLASDLLNRTPGKCVAPLSKTPPPNTKHLPSRTALSYEKQEHENDVFCSRLLRHFHQLLIIAMTRNACFVSVAEFHLENK